MPIRKLALAAAVLAATTAHAQYGMEQMMNSMTMMNPMSMGMMNPAMMTVPLQGVPGKIQVAVDDQHVFTLTDQ